MSHNVVGLDLSLTGTGVAGNGWTKTISFPKLRGHARLDAILREMCGEAFAGLAPDERVALVVIEGPAYGAIGGSMHERAGLWWLVTHTILHERRIPYAVVPPTSLKKYATGKGTAGKDLMLVTATRQFDWFDGDNNAADALWLAAMGHDQLGSPLVSMPAVNRTAMQKIKWPEVTA